MGKFILFIIALAGYAPLSSVASSEEQAGGSNWSSVIDGIELDKQGESRGIFSIESFHSFLQGVSAGRESRDRLSCSERFSFPPNDPADVEKARLLGICASGCPSICRYISQKYRKDISVKRSEKLIAWGCLLGNSNDCFDIGKKIGVKSEGGRAMVARACRLGNSPACDELVSGYDKANLKKLDSCDITSIELCLVVASKPGLARNEREEFYNFACKNGLTRACENIKLTDADEKFSTTMASCQRGTESACFQAVKLFESEDKKSVPHIAFVRYSQMLQDHCRIYGGEICAKIPDLSSVSESAAPESLTHLASIGCITGSSLACERKLQLIRTRFKTCMKSKSLDWDCSNLEYDLTTEKMTREKAELSIHRCVVVGAFDSCLSLVQDKAFKEEGKDDLERVRSAIGTICGNQDNIQSCMSLSHLNQLPPEETFYIYKSVCEVEIPPIGPKDSYQCIDKPRQDRSDACEALAAFMEKNGNLNEAAKYRKLACPKVGKGTALADGTKQKSAPSQWPCYVTTGKSIKTEADARRIFASDVVARKASALDCLADNNVIDSSISNAALRYLRSDNTSVGLLRGSSFRYLLKNNGNIAEIRSAITKLGGVEKTAVKISAVGLMASLSCFDCKAGEVLKRWGTSSNESVRTIATRELESLPVSCRDMKKWYPKRPQPVCK
jgi:hypothetical protein